MDKKADPTPAPTRKRLIGLALGLLVFWALYQWYYVSSTCSKDSKAVWMWITPDGDSAKHPDKPRFVLLRIPSAYIPKYDNPEYRWGGHVDFISMDLTMGEAMPNCLRNLEHTHKEGRHWITRFPENEEYSDGFDLKKLTVLIDGPMLGGGPEPDANMKIKENTIYGLDIYTKNTANNYVGAYLYSNDKNSPKRSGWCGQLGFDDSSDKLSLCTMSAKYHGLKVAYTFHVSQISRWREIEQEAFKFIDSIVIARL